MPLFIRKPVEHEVVEAEYIGPGAQAHIQGSRPARPGEWVVTNHSTGEQKLMSDDDFKAMYQEVPVPSSLAPQPVDTTPNPMPHSDELSPEPVLLSMPVDPVPVGDVIEAAEAAPDDAEPEEVLDQARKKK